MALEGCQAGAWLRLLSRSCHQLALVGGLFVCMAHLTCPHPHLSPTWDPSPQRAPSQVPLGLFLPQSWLQKVMGKWSPETDTQGSEFKARLCHKSHDLRGVIELP